MGIMRTSAVLLVCSVFGVALGDTTSSALTLTSSEESKKAPWFCHGIECPKYTVVDTKDAYETRTYEATKWASTTITGTQLSAAERTGFMRLFSYISGDNMPASKIPMTAPVKNLITPGEGPFCGSNFTVSFFVPYEFQAETPAPTGEFVHLTYEDAVTVYVRSFAGFAKEATIVDEAAKLAQALDADGAQYDAEKYVSAGYDPPFRPVNRHNEIWFFSK